jgi:hypothetical protein
MNLSACWSFYLDSYSGDGPLNAERLATFQSSWTRLREFELRQSLCGSGPIGSIDLDLFTEDKLFDVKSDLFLLPQ